MLGDDFLFWLSPFALLVGAGFCLHPIPEELIIVGAGVATGTEAGARYGAYRWVMLPLCLLGAGIADVLLYGIGRFFGTRILRIPVLAKLSPPEKQDKIRDNFDRYGVWIFVIGRLVPGIRTALFVTAGSMRLPLVRFCVADGIGALFGTSLFFLLGYGLGRQFEETLKHFKEEITPYEPIILFTILLGIAGYLLSMFLRHPTVTGDPEEVPLIGKEIAKHLPVHDSKVVLPMEGRQPGGQTPEGAQKGPTDTRAVEKEPTGPKTGPVERKA